RDAAEHRAVRRQRPSGDERAVRHVGGAAGRHAARRCALRRVDDLPRRARLRAARRLAQLLARGGPSAGSDVAANPVSPDWLAGGRDERLRPQGTLSYVSGPTDEPPRFITLPQQPDKTVSRRWPRAAAAFDAQDR